MDANRNDMSLHRASEPLLNCSSGMHPMARAVSSEQLASLQGTFKSTASLFQCKERSDTLGKPLRKATQVCREPLQVGLTSGGACMQAKSSPCRARSR